MNPSIGSVGETRIEIQGEHRSVLSGRVWAAPNPRALIGIVHGIGEHCGRYAALASDLVHAGFTVAAFDWPGHGESPGPRGDVRSWTWVRDHVVPALFTATRELRGQPERPPCIVIGHSMGGAMALDFALAHPREIVAVIASAPALRTTMPPLWKLALANVARVTVPSLGFPTGIDDAGISRAIEVFGLGGDALDLRAHRARHDTLRGQQLRYDRNHICRRDEGEFEHACFRGAARPHDRVPLLRAANVDKLAARKPCETPGGEQRIERVLKTHLVEVGRDACADTLRDGDIPLDLLT